MKIQKEKQKMHKYLPKIWKTGEHLGDLPCGCLCRRSRGKKRGTCFYQPSHLCGPGRKRENLYFAPRSHFAICGASINEKISSPLPFRNFSFHSIPGYTTPIFIFLCLSFRNSIPESMPLCLPVTECPPWADVSKCRAIPLSFRASREIYFSSKNHG